MTPKQKADELIEQFFDANLSLSISHAKQCALIAVDEIIKALNDHSDEIVTINTDYWQAVKDELTKL